MDPDDTRLLAVSWNGSAFVSLAHSEADLEEAARACRRAMDRAR